MTATAVDVMVVMPVLFRRRGGTGTHKPTVGQDRDGASSQAPTRSLPPAVRAQGVSRPADGSPTGQPSRVPAVHSGQAGRENVLIQHPCRSSASGNDAAQRVIRRYLLPTGDLLGVREKEQRPVLPH